MIPTRPRFPGTVSLFGGLSPEKHKKTYSNITVLIVMILKVEIGMSLVTKREMYPIFISKVTLYTDFVLSIYKCCVVIFQKPNINHNTSYVVQLCTLQIFTSVS